MSRFEKLQILTATTAMVASTIMSGGIPIAKAAETFSGTLKKVDSVTTNENTVEISYNDGAVHGKITFLEDGIFRFNVDPANEFGKYAKPRNKSDVARIQAQPDESDTYQHPKATVKTEGTDFIVDNGSVKIRLNKETALMSVYNKNGDLMFAEQDPLQIGSQTKQTLVSDQSETYYGGGTQNGRFTHRGEIVRIENDNKYTDGGVSSPNPFYWSSAGYGVLRNTFSQGTYDFAKTDATDVVTTHDEKEFDAYYFVASDKKIDNVATEVLQEYYKVTGAPVLLPEYGFYLGHLNCYNRDGWAETAQPKVDEKDGSKQWTLENGEKWYENGMHRDYVLTDKVFAESLNGTGPTLSKDKFLAKDTPYIFSARAVIDGHVDQDMPLGWFLPNDGYGCGYGQNGYYQTGGDSAERTAAIDANVNNLKEFTEYANSKGVESGLWTQSDLTPAASGQWQKLRDFKKEVEVGGARTLKTDVAWVGSGYSFGLNGTKYAYNVLTDVNARPNIVSLDGWAGSQRYVSIWTGDQYGGNWEYIRFHIPTYIGQSLSGNPNVASDMDGIFAGAPVIATRDYQWKAFTPQMLDMDGWGSIAKKPYESGDPYTAINRMYLKLKAEMMPYTYTLAHEATGLDQTSGLPMIRAMFLEFPEDETAKSKDMQYQYMYGENFLVAPVYQDTASNASGDDIRNGIYLPDEDQVWIDYFTGKQYRGGQTLNNYDAPLWKLPLFVKNGAIVPMYEENNNPSAISNTNTKGLDKSKRVVEFWPSEKETSFDLYEDDGFTMENNQTEDEEYGTIEHISYGQHVSTKFTSKVEGDKATLTANVSSGTYNGYDANRDTKFVVNVSAKPDSIEAMNGSAKLNVTESTSLAEFEAATPAEGAAVWFYDETPNLNKYAKDEEAFKAVKIETTPKVYVKFANTNVSNNAQTLIVNGFVNDGNLGKNELNNALTAPANFAAPEELKTPTSIDLSWDAVAGATSYEVEIDGVINAIGNKTTFKHDALAYNSTHTYAVRARNVDGFSAWSEKVVTASLKDPWRNAPDMTINWDGGDQWGKLSNANDHNLHSIFHSTNGDARDRDMILDLGKAYELDQFEYYPRGTEQDGTGSVGVNSNGTVKQLDVYTSMDGVHWTQQQKGAEHPWTYTAGASVEESVKTVPLSGAARYVKLRVVESNGGFFSANELVVYKLDGSNGFAVGSNTMKPEVNEGDITNMRNYLGIANRAEEASTFDAQIKKHHADLNNNDIYDVYDYAYTLFNIDGGTKQTGKVAGNILMIPSKNTVKAGEEFTVELYGSGLENVNALGAIIEYDPAKYEFVGFSKGVVAAGLGNYTTNKVYTDGTAIVNIALSNRGDQKTINGEGSLATLRMKAKVDGDALSPTESIIIGPEFDFKNVNSEQGNINIPEIPLTKEAVYTKDDFNMTMTNSSLPTDDGTNVEKFIHQNSYDGLFDETADDFEFKYNWGNGDNLSDSQKEENEAYNKEWLKMPVTLHYEMKTPNSMNNITLKNRANLGNGAVEGVLFTVNFDDGTKETKEFTGKEAVYSYDLVETTKKISSIDIELRGASEGVKALTISQIKMTRTDTQKVERVELDANNVKELYAGDVTPINAQVKPDDIANPYYKVKTADETIASILAIQDDKGIQYFLKANNPGTTTVTVTAAGDEAVSASYEVNVKEGVSTVALDQAIAKGQKIDNVYTKETFDALQAAIKAGEDLLASGAFTKEQINTAAMDIETAISKLILRPIDQETLINQSADSIVNVIDFSSERGPNSGDPSLAESVLDYDEGSFWHSDYVNSVGMPQYLTFDLGRRYNLTDVAFLARQNGTNGDIRKAHIEVSLDNKTWTTLSAYEFANNGKTLENRDEYKQMAYPSVTARYVKFVVDSALGNDLDAYASMSEIRFYGSAYVSSDTSELQTLYDANKDKANDNYTPASWTAFTNALADAKNVLTSEYPTQAEVDAAADRLQKAIDGLTHKADLSKLLEAVKKAESLTAADYTSSTWNQLESAVKAGKALTLDGNVTQDAVDAATKNINDAINGLEKASGKPNIPDQPNNPNVPSIPDRPTVNPDHSVTIPNADQNMSVTGQLDQDMQFITRKLTSQEVKNVMDSIKDKDFLNFYRIDDIYDLSLMKGGITVQPDGKITVRILLDRNRNHNNPEVYYIADDGTLTKMVTRRGIGYLEFDTTHFSRFAIVSKKGDDVIKETATSPINDGFGMNMIMLVFAGATFVAFEKARKKKA